jgi:glycosyltransferase involved in cell wall biosynthesis
LSRPFELNAGRMSDSGKQNAAPLSVCYSMADQAFEQTKSLGIFNLSTGLLSAMAEHPSVERIPVLGNSGLRKVLPDSTELRCHDRATRGKVGRICWDQWGVYSAARRTTADWLFLPKGFASFVRRPGMRLATYVHDTIQEFYREKYPDAVSGFEQAYFRRCFRATLQHSDVIFTNSEFTAAEVRRVSGAWGITPPRVLRAGIGFRQPEINEERENCIAVLIGRYPHKLTEQAIDWMQRWHADRDVRVDWIGNLPSGVHLPNRPGWIHHSRLPEAEFRRRVNSARALVFFSEYEGFGMPPVEAALAGVCPVFSAIPATTEVMEGTGLEFENDCYDSFAKAMDQSFTLSREHIADWGARLTDQHSWTKVADRVVAGLNSVGQA